MNKVVRRVVAFALSLAATTIVVQPAHALVCTSWCVISPFTTTSTIDAQFFGGDQFFATMTETSLKVYSSDTRTLKLTVAVPAGKKYRGMKPSPDGRYLFGFTDKTVVRIDSTTVTSVNATPDAFSSLWDGDPPPDIYSEGVKGGILDLAPVADGSSFYAITNDYWSTVAYKVTVATRTVTQTLLSDIAPGDTGAFAALLPSGKLLSIAIAMRSPSDYGDSVIWDPANESYTNTFTQVGHDTTVLSSTRIGTLVFNSGTDLRLFNPNVLSSTVWGVGPTTVTQLHLRRAANTAFVGAVGLVQFPNGVVYTNDFNSITQAGVPYKSAINSVNLTSGVMTPVSQITIQATNLKRDVAGTVMLVSGPGGVQAVYPGTSTSAPINLKATRTALGAYSLGWTLVNLNSGLVIKDYIIEYQRTSNNALSTVTDAVSTNRTASVTGLTAAGKVHVKAVYTNGTVSAWSPWVTLPQ